MTPTEPPTDEWLTREYADTLFRGGVRSPESTAAVIGFKAGLKVARLQSPVTEPTEPSDEEIEAAAHAFGGLVVTHWEHAADWEREHVRDHLRLALIAAARIRKGTK